MQRSVWVRHFEMCHIKVKKTKRRKKERDRAVECQQCRCFQHTVTLHVCTRVCVCACVCTSWLPMCLTNNHNLATLPRSRRRHFTLPSPWRSALPHTHTHSHTALQCALQTHSLPLRCLWFYLIWPCLASTHFSESIVHRFTSYIVIPPTYTSEDGIWHDKLLHADNETVQLVMTLESRVDLQYVFSPNNSDF